MAITIVDNRIILNEADSTTGWTATDGPTVVTAAPDPVESTGCLAMQVSNGIQNAYVGITSDDYSGGGSLFVLMADRAEFDTTVNGGIGIQVGDGTNRIAYHVGGSDGTGFRHDEGAVKWASFQIDLANKPANFTAIAGSEASLNEAAITQVGVYFETIAKSVGGADNCFWDIIRFADNGVGIEFYGGTAGTPESWSTVTVQDRATGNQQAHYVIRQVGAGVYDIQGNINIGDPTSTNSTYINSDTEVFIFGDRGQSTNNYYRFNGSGNGTGTTDINFDNCIFNNALSGSMDFTDANITADFRTCTFIGWDQGIQTGGSGNIWNDGIYSDCGTVISTGAPLLRSTYTGFTGVADDSQLFWNSTSDPDGDIDGSSFTMGANDTHAIEFPTGMTNTSITIRDCEFSGYSASNNVNSSTFNVLATTGTLTINVIGGSGNVSYKTAGATVIVVQNPVTTTVTVNDNTGTALSGARVYLPVTSDAGGYPFEASVTISQTGGTATVSHTGHGLSSNQWVNIEDANENAYNGVKQITVTTANAYTFSIDPGTSSPATGTITSTAVIIHGTTDVNGEISDSRTFSANQPVAGWARSASGSPYFKQGALNGTISSTNGLSISVNLVLDE